MEYRRLGRSGLQVSALSLGSWVTFAKQVDVSAARDIMAHAYDSGINFFDNAEGYENGGSEIVMGQAIAQLKWTRDSFVVSSKVFFGGEKPNQKGLSRKHVFDACHAALKRLQVDYLDLFFCHRPDVDTPISETVRAMHDLVSQGKVMYWGTSEWSAQQLTEAYAVARSENLIGPTMEQPQYNMFHRDKVEKEFLPVYELMGLGTTIWSPLYSGILTGKYQKEIPEDSRLNLPGYEWLKARMTGEGHANMVARVASLSALSDELSMPLHHLAINWCLKNPRVSTVILGVSRRSQLEDNLASMLTRDRVTESVMHRVDEILGNKPVPDPRF